MPPVKFSNWSEVIVVSQLMKLMSSVPKNWFIVRDMYICDAMVIGSMNFATVQFLNDAILW